MQDNYNHIGSNYNNQKEDALYKENYHFIFFSSFSFLPLQSPPPFHLLKLWHDARVDSILLNPCVEKRRLSDTANIINTAQVS